MKTETKTLNPELLHQMDAYWRAANYLSAGQIYLYDNPLLKQPLKLGTQTAAARPLGHDAGAELHLRST
jgi:phosphoketolase